MEEKEKKEIQDAEISEVKVDSENGDDSNSNENLNVDSNSTEKSYRTEMILILIIGLLLGIMIKAEALKSLSIGFSDYRVKGGKQGYDTVAIEKKMKEEAELKKAEAEEAAKEAQKNKANNPSVQSENPNNK